MPPPWPNEPFGGATTTRVPVTELWLSVSEPMLELLTPPPPAPSGTAPGAPTWLSLVRVLVTALVETVGSASASSWPIVTTGPPPLITVLPAPAPSSCTLVVIVIQPANVPGSILIVSPSCEAASAAWIIPKQPGLAPTQRV